MMRDKSRTKPYYQALYRGNRLLWAVIMALVVIQTPLNLVGTWLLGEAFNVMAGGTLEELGRLAVYTVCFLVMDATVITLILRLRMVFYKRAVSGYQIYAFSQLSQKSVAAFTREETGRYLSVLTEDVNQVQSGYLNGSFQIVSFFCMGIGSAAMMFYYSPPLALLAIASALVTMAVAVPLGKEAAVRETALSDQRESFMSQLKDLLAGFSVIKSFKAEKMAEEQFQNAHIKKEAVRLRRNWWECVVALVQQYTGGIVQFGLTLVGAYMVLRGSLALGTALIMVNLVNYLVQPISTLPTLWAQRKAAKALVEKLADVIQENSAQKGVAVQPVLEREIVFQDVRFGYEPEKPVLCGVSAVFSAGKRYAVVGASGSGKSTLLRLLLAGHGNYSGSITLDGQELREIDSDSLYDLVSVVEQNVFIFNARIRENITMFGDFPKADVDRAITQSGLREFVTQRGEDYPCGENGSALSGGERQRISIARCLLRKAPVLLVDEATAALDKETAHHVTSSILALEGLTRIVVTHALEESLLRQFDGILAMKNGQIVESGNFDTLMEKKGYFYSLYTVSQ